MLEAKFIVINSTWKYVQNNAAISVCLSAHKSSLNLKQRWNYH